MAVTYEELKRALKNSKFRSRFKLDPADKEYIQKAGLEKIRAHAKEFITQRIAPENPKNDGKQTPWKGHPVFKAQHANAICCRSCLAKWHKIPKNRSLTENEVDNLTEIIMSWINEHL